MAKTRKAKERAVIASIKDVRVSFYNQLTKSHNEVIRGTGFELYEGEILGLIGESGSGKSVISSLLNGLLGESGSINAGEVRVLDNDVTNWTEKEWIKSELRGRVVGRVFQNPMSALTPSLKIKYQLIESLLDFKIYKTEEECIEAVVTLLDRMNVVEPRRVLGMYPHELSGGMIQRVVLAIIIALNPKVIILDEPTTALDPIVQAEIIQIIKKLNVEMGISFIFITHDIGVIANISDRIAVMYAGRVIEYGTKEEVLFKSAHPYTWGLLSSLPSNAINGRLSGIEGTLDSSLLTENQDAFVYRNQYALEIDLHERPPMYKINDNHYAATWLLDKRAPKFKKPEFIIQLEKNHK